MAGPSGTKLIDLHMTDRGQTSEMHMPNRRLGSDSELRKILEKAARDISKRIANIVPGLLLLGIHVAIMGLSLVVADFLLAQLRETGIDLTLLLPPALSAMGPHGVTIGVGLVLAAVLVAALEVSGTMRGLRRLVTFDDPAVPGEDDTFAMNMKIKPDFIHFGNLPVSYDITQKGLLIRSLGDRFVAVLAITPDAKVKLAPRDVYAAYKGWYGDNVTPPVVIEVEDADYKTKLLISGMHFETPGADSNHNIARAEAFKDALAAAASSSQGHHHDDHH